MGQLSDVKQYT